MLEEESDGTGGEEAGDVKIPVTLNNCAPGTIGAANPIVAISMSGDAGASGSRKSCVHALDVAWLGAGW